MKRLLRASFLGSCLLLCLGSMMLWGGSYFWFIEVSYYIREYDPLRHYYSLDSIILDRGSICLHFGSVVSRAGEIDLGWQSYVDSPEDHPFGANLKRNLWFYHYSFVSNTGTDDHEFGIPFWLPVLVFAVLPALELRTHLRARRVKEGHCPHCGYDLRATPDRCPECGKTPSV